MGTSLFEQYQQEQAKGKGKKKPKPTAPNTPLGQQYVAEQTRNATLPSMAPVVANIPETTPGKQFLTEIGQGATLGIVDEALGAMNALPGGVGGKTAAERYRYGRDLVRAADADAKAAHPVGSMATQAASGMLTSLPTMLPRAVSLVKAPLTLGGQVAAGVKTGATAGAAYGAVSGAANAEGGLEERARGGATGGLVGAAGGAVIGGLTPVAANAVTKLVDLVGRQQIAAGTKAAAEAKAAILSGITDPAERAQVEALIANDPVLGPAFNPKGTAVSPSRAAHLTARAGVGGTARTGPYVPGEQPQGMVDFTGNPKLSRDQRGLLQRLGVGETPEPKAPVQPTPIVEQKPNIPNPTGGYFDRTGAIDIRGMGQGQPSGRMVATAEDRANEELLKVLGRDQQSPASIRAAFTKAQAEGNTPLNLMDLSGENAQGLGRAARAAPSTAKNLIPKVLEARGKEAETRVIGKLLETTGQGRRINLTQSIDQMAEERAKDAEKLYAPIRDKVVDAPEISDALKMDAMQKAYERARNIAKNKAGAAKLRGAGDGTASLPPYGELFDKSGALKKPLTLGQLDQIKRGIDDMLETAPRSASDAGGLGNEGMGALRDLKNAFVGVLDAAVPEYQQARSVFAGHSAMIRAFETGKTLFTKSPDEMSALLSGMSQAEQDAFRKGAVEALSQKIETVTPGNSVSLRVADKTRDQQRLRLLFPDQQSYDAFRASVAQEALAHLTKTKVLGNSATVDKLAEFADLAGVDLGDVFHSATNAKGFIMGGIQKGARKLADRSMASKADALAPKLLASGKSLEDVLAGLEAASQRLAKQQGRRVGRTTAASAGIGTATPKPRQEP